MNKDKTTLCTFWSFVSNLSNFASIQRGEKIIINKSLWKYIAADDVRFVKVKKIMINIWNLDTAIGLKVLEMAF